MDILSLFVIVPILTIITLVFTKNLKLARQVSMVGSIFQLGMAINLIIAYFKERAINDSIMVFTKDLVWFQQFNIHYSIGVDGISVALITLTTIVVMLEYLYLGRCQNCQKNFLYHY